jgi:flagellar hook-associated protein 3 FlgL
MRIANKMIYDHIVTQLNSTATAMANANKVISTGKRINDLSDDPVGLVTVLDLRGSLANMEQLQDNISMGRSWLNMGESVLGETEEILTQAKTMAIEMSSSSREAADRAMSAEVVDGYMREILSLANTQVSGRSIFAGTKTDTDPFYYDETGTGEVVYNGNSTPFAIQLGSGIQVDIGRDGREIYGTNWDDNNIFKTLVDFKTALETDDVAAIQGIIDKLETHLETIRSVSADTGSKSIRLDVKERIVEDLTLSYTERTSSIEDADIAEAVVNLQSKELAYQAALSSSAKVMNLSLVNYI